MSKEEILEYKRCMDDPVHFARRYCKVISLDKGLVDFDLYPYQEKMFDHFNTHRFNIVLACRQSGKSISSVAYILWFALFHSEKTVAILAPNLMGNICDWSLIRKIADKYDLKVIEGQATVFLEILNHYDEMIDYLFIPIGGGGLISGAINVFKQLSPQTKIIGIEPLGAPSMLKSIQQNQLVTLEKINGFVDGAAVKKVGTYSSVSYTHLTLPTKA